MRLEKQWDQPLPPWTETIKKEVASKIERSRFAQECRAGNVTVIKKMLQRFWPFVKRYPTLVEAGTNNAKWHLLKRLKIGSWWDFRTTGMTMLGMLWSEKERHRDLWLASGHAVGIDLTSFMYSNPVRNVEVLIDLFKRGFLDPWIFFYRAAAVEIFAEALSVHLLESDQLKNVLKPEGCEWLAAHARNTHKGITHEALMYNLGFWFFEKELSRYYVDMAVQDTVDLFIQAAEETTEKLK